MTNQNYPHEQRQNFKEVEKICLTMDNIEYAREAFFRSTLGNRHSTDVDIAERLIAYADELKALAKELTNKKGE
jgi:hypothetical protein